MAIIQLKRGSSSRWIELNPILEAGEPGYETDTGRMKIGDGERTWSQLNYQDENAIVARDNFSAFPAIGRDNIIYKENSTGNLYEYKDGRYVKLTTSSGGGSLDEITMINGGNANGTN